MRTTIYLATACGIAVIHGCDESWVGEVCLNDKQIQCVAADRTRKALFTAEPFGNGMLRPAAGDGYFESVDGGNSWRRVVDGLEHQYCWSIAISLADSKTLLLSTSKSAYGAHYKESANSVIYRRTGSDAWKPVRKGLPDPQGLRIPVVAASSSEPGVFYCSTEGMVYRSEDDGLQWRKLAVQWNSKATAEHATGMAIVEEC